MGELILCTKPSAQRPYYLESASLNVYSLEELCYYIKNNTFLLDAGFMDDRLCNWIERELQQKDTAKKLRDVKEQDGILSEFVGCLLAASSYCTFDEQQKIINTVQEMEHKSEFECGKIKADRYLENQNYVLGIYEYQKLLKTAEKEQPHIVGAVWHNLGTAYAKLFLFGQAAECYSKAYEQNNNPESLRECLMAYWCDGDEQGLKEKMQTSTLPSQEIRKIADELERYSKNNAIWQLPPMKSGEEKSKSMWEAQLGEWKKQYRKDCMI